MKNVTNIRMTIFVTIMALSALLLSSAAHAWDPATHAYIETHLYKKKGQSYEAILANRIYGSYMIDISNNIFADPYPSFSDYLHDPSQANFMKLWDLAKDLGSGPQKAFAYGFVSHNNSWGMDSTAHISGITYGRGTGYVTAKAQALGGMIGPAFSDMGMPLPDAVLQDVAHYLVEAGVDFLVLGLDPSIGYKIMLAAYARGNDIPQALVSAFTTDLAAKYSLPEPIVEQMILQAEAGKQEYLKMYGWALTQPNALDLVAQGLAVQGAAYFASQGYGQIPPDLLAPVAKEGIIAAMWLCAGDFQDELSATTGWVNGRLSSEGIVW